MPVVAIAGGTSPSLGRSITLAVLERYSLGEWTSIILSRYEKRPLWLQAIDPQKLVEVVAVDYGDKASIGRALKRNGVDICISVILTKDHNQLKVMIDLLDAAIEAGVKRFVPSYWGPSPQGWKDVGLLNVATHGVWDACLARANERKINVARFNSGMHKIYLGIGAHETKSLPENEQVRQLRDGNGYAAGFDGPVKA